MEEPTSREMFKQLQDFIKNKGSKELLQDMLLQAIDNHNFNYNLSDELYCDYNLKSWYGNNIK